MKTGTLKVNPYHLYWGRMLVCTLYAKTVSKDDFLLVGTLDSGLFLSLDLVIRG